MSDYYYDLCMEEGDPIKVGWVDQGDLNKELFAEITDKCLGYTVVGYLASLDVSHSASWESKMAQDNIDDKIPWTAILQTGGLGQVLDSDIVEAFKGRTHFTKSQTRQVWTDTAPLNVSMTLLFIAFKDAKQEVELPTVILEKMISSEIKESLTDSYKNVINETINSIQAGEIPSLESIDDILGYIPNELNIYPLDRKYKARWIINDVSYSDSEVLIDGYGSKVIREVTLGITSTTSLNKSDINLWDSEAPD